MSKSKPSHLIKTIFVTQKCTSKNVSLKYGSGYS